MHVHLNFHTLLTFYVNFIYILERGDTKLLEAATSALREALHKLAEVQCVLLGDVKDSDLQVRMISTSSSLLMFTCSLSIADIQKYGLNTLNT